MHTCMAFDWCLLRGHRFGVKGHLRSFPAPAKMRKIGPNWPYLGLWKTDKARTCYSDATLMVGEAYNGLDPKGQSSRSKVKIYRQAPIELKVTRNNPCDILSTIQVQLTPSVTQGSSCRGQRSNFKNHRHAWIELKFSSNDPCDTLNMRKMHLITFVTQGSSYMGQRSQETSLGALGRLRSGLLVSVCLHG